VLDRNLFAPHAVSRWAGSHPDRLALRHVDGRTLTYRELDEEGRRWADGLGRLGVGAGHHVGTFLPHDFDGFRALLAVARHCAVEVPLNTAYVGGMLRHALTLAEVVTLVTTTELAARLEPMADELPDLRTVVLVDDPDGSGFPFAGAPWRVVGREELLAGTVPLDLPGPEEWDLAALIFTSGTTGPSKAVRMPWGQVHHLWGWCPEDAFEEGEALFSAFPLFHISGRGAFNVAMARGGTLAMRDKFSISSFWDDIRTTGAVSAGLVGPLTGLIYAQPPSPRDRDHPLRTVVLGPMIPEMEDFEQRFGVKVCAGFGQTEIGCPIVTGWDHGPWANSGKPAVNDAGFEARIVDEHDQPVGPGVVGELVVRARAPWRLNLGYHNNPEATAHAWRNGWFHTGDAMMTDEEGRFYFVDRMKDAIRRRGENISSFEVEAAVGEHPDVVECAALGVRMDHADEEVMVVVIVRDPDRFDPAELIRFLVPRMPRFMVPRFVAVVDDFPRSETTARVRKEELRNLHLEEKAFDRVAAGIEV
jgi:crotonobetaine/carnitine-CoA ligase